MLYLSIAIVISVALITVFGIHIDFDRTHQEVFEPVEPIKFESPDTFDEDGDEKEELKGQLSMDEYIKSINDLMVGEDDE